MESIWLEDVPGRQPFARLKGDIRTDVLVIGGGMAGVLCALLLSQAGVDCALVEAKTLGSGITGNTTAKITAQHGLVYQQLAKRFGLEGARLYLRANLQAVEKYRALCADMDCSFEERDAFVYARDGREALDRELRVLRQIGYSADFVSSLPLPFATAGAVRFPAQAQFHPLKFLTAAARGLRIYEHTAVRELRPGAAVTDTGCIAAGQIIVATHFPFLNKHGSYFLKLYQDRSYVLALEGAQDVGGMYLDADSGGLSFRNAGELLLIGGGAHRTGKKGEGWAGLRSFAEQHYPRAREAACWAAQDCMTLDGMPYIGRYSARTQGLYVATGFQKWGMTSSMIAAMLLTDCITGRKSPYAALFSPSRSILRPQLAVNAFEAVTNLLSLSTKRCPHLGCALKWNPAERSWDCPCHGSRFDEEGSLLDNPAAGDLGQK